MNTPKTKQLIKIGESLHASVARCGEAMLKDYNDNCKDSLNYIISLISQQAQAGADFIEINVDKFSEISSQTAAGMIERYVRLIAQHGQNIPVCIDSSSDELLEIGLKEWYSSEGKVKKPLINSIKPENADKMFEISKQYPFEFIGLLMCQEPKVEDIVSQGEAIFEKATNFGFKPAEIYFDTCAFPLATDLPMMGGECSRTFTAFEGIKALKSIKKMQGVHFSLGISNCARYLPAKRTEVIAAYLAKSIEYGLDTAIIDVRIDWFAKKPDEKLLEMISSFAKLNGEAEGFAQASQLMADFCRDCRESKEAK